MYSCTMPVPDSGGGGGGLGGTCPASRLPEEDVSVLKNRALYDIVSIYGNGFGWFSGGLGWFVCFKTVNHFNF